MAGGLGKGLDSLIPNIYDENFDSNGSQSLEDILNEKNESENEIESIVDDITTVSEEKSDTNTEGEDIGKNDTTTDGIGEENTQDKASEKVSASENPQDTLQTTQEVKKKENVAEVLDIVDKNPRITLWSSRSAAVFRYLRKTEPEFSISREASILIDEAVSKKYPHIWELFEGI